MTKQSQHTDSNAALPNRKQSMEMIFFLTFLGQLLALSTYMNNNNI